MGKPAFAGIFRQIDAASHTHRDGDQGGQQGNQQGAEDCIAYATAAQPRGWGQLGEQTRPQQAAALEQDISQHQKKGQDSYCGKDASNTIEQNIETVAGQIGFEK